MVRVLTKAELRSLHRLAERLESQGMAAEGATLRNIVRTGSARREVRASVAAQIMHVTSQTIRNWVKRGLLAGRSDETGHVWVEVDALRRLIELDAAIPYRSPSEPEITVQEILAEIKDHRAEQRASRRSAP